MSEFDFASEYAAFGDDLKGVSFEGEYDMIVQKVVAGTSPKGKQMFTVTLGFTGGPNKAKNRTVSDRLYWSPESDTAARIFAANLKVMGASQEWVMSARPTPEQIAERMTGTVVSVRLRPDEFNGQATTRVSYLKTVSAKSGDNAAAASGSAAKPEKVKSVKLDDAAEGTTVVTPTAAAPAAQEDVDTATGEVKEPATAGVGASQNPWA
jgi:hypothetical protein